MKSLKMWERVLSALKTDPLHKITPASICGLAFLIGYYFKFYAAISFSVLFFFCASIFAIKKYYFLRHLNTYLMFILFAFIGSLTCVVHFPEKQHIKLAKFWGKDGIVWEGKILPFSDVYPDKVRFIVRVHRIFTHNKIYEINEKIVFNVKNPSLKWLPGDTFVTNVTIKKPRNFNNPGRLDYVLYLARKKIFGLAYSKSDVYMAKTQDFEANSSSLFAIVRASEKQRQKISQCILKATRKNKDPAAANGILQAMLVGYRHFLQQPFIDQISFAGVRHIVAISGLHFGCMAGLIFLVMQAVIRKFMPTVGLYLPVRTAAAIFCLPALTCYALITGLAAPSFRAFIFTILTLFIFALYRSIDKSTLLIITACLIILINPYEAHYPSFILSFIAVAAIMYVAIPLKQQSEEYESPFVKTIIKRSIEWVIWVSFVVQISLFAICLYFFYRFPFIGFISNPTIVPFVTLVILPIGLVFMIISLLSKSLAVSFYAIFYSKLVDLLVHFIKFFGSFSYLTIWNPRISWISVSVYTGLFLLAGIYLKQSSLFKKIISLSLFPLIFLGILNVEKLIFNKKDAWLHATILDVSQGSSTFIKLPDGYTFLIDGGGFRYSNFDLGKNVLIPFLASQHATHIDSVILSHYHPDHAKGLLFFARYYPVSQFWETGCHNRYFKFPNLARIFKTRHVKIYSIKELYGKHRFGSVYVEILNPRPEDFPHICKNLNKSSMVLQFTYGKTSIIIPSDIDKETLSHLDFQRKDNTQTILVAPHHGSKYSFDTLTFEKINPCMVVVSCGYKNPYGSPHPSLLKWCRKRKVLVTRTDTNGAIMLKTNGKKWLFNTFGTDHHWRKTKCGTTFSATYMETSRRWKPVCNILKN